MALSFVKLTKIQSSTGSSCSGSVSSTAANALVCHAASFVGTTSGSNLSASGGGTWASDTSVTDVNDVNSKFKGLIASCPSATGGAQTITVSNGQANGVTAVIYEFSGNPTSGLRSVTSPAVAAGTSTSPAANALATPTAGSLLSSMFVGNDGGNPATVTGTKAGWTFPAGAQETNGATFQTMGSGYRITGPEGANEGGAWTSGNFRWDALVAVYSPQGVASSGTRTRPWTQLRPAPFKPGGERPTAFRRIVR